ncbi:type I-E CRISPR-associated protein Cas7/Cse4/CasC [Changpingibacter yushuensis]|uniref:type I-E CRISPR-associated protein Cas7/Cse4/CasC n=1 Tax=Changpingibacter yushuensis TaxID=2758440 RepID=UPI00165E66B5|nr:type I-E CRISPR-associated protein Cas7/Cse4/CasC [Changpingibacter yushuensis]
MSETLTIHKIVPIPYSNLNRDDTGTPKRIHQGGVLRAMLSSQSIKRAVRTDYENRSMTPSYRSANLADIVAERACELNPELDEKEAGKQAKKLIGALTKGSEATDGEAGRSAWLSKEELEIAAANVASGSEDAYINKEKTGALAIAAFGRMFAAQQDFNTEAALSVSPAISTHAALIETDYFSTVDDSPTEKQGKGATYLGVAAYTSATMYQTVTIDRAQLRASWTGLAAPDARDLLEVFVKSLIYKLPRGKEHGTAPYTYPQVVLVEEQNYRMAYDFETPVVPGVDGGFTENSVKRLAEQREAAHQFDPGNFGQVSLIGGTVSKEQLETFGVDVVNLDAICDTVVDWILENGTNG